MNRRHYLLWSVLLAAVFICLAVFTTDTQNAGKKPDKAAHLPKRIVSLAPSNTEILFALGLGSRVVGVTRYCDYPPEARKKPNVGDMNTNMEKVVSLHPDLILAHGKMNDNLISRLRGLKLNTLVVDPKSFEQLYRDIKRVGDATGSASRAEKVVSSMARTVSSVKAGTARTKPKKVLVIVQPNPLWVAGPRTFVDEMLSYSKAQNVARDASPGFVSFSSEVAVSRNPDVIIVSRREERDFILQSPIWRQTNAVRQHRVYVVDGDLLFRAGPRLARGLEQVARDIHPEAIR